MTETQVALVTSEEGIAHDEDMPLLVDALGNLGVATEVWSWDDPAAQWGSVDLAVIRSTWDYTARRDEFIAWARRCEAVTRLENPASLLSWNTDKRYLGELATRGIATVPSTFVAPGEDVQLPRCEFVVKPTVSAGSRDTARYEPGQEQAALAQIAQLHAAGKDVMIQPYIASVDERGETALICVNGKLIHSIAKGPLLERGAEPSQALFVREVIEPRDASKVERDFADDVLDALAEPPLYARVDVVLGDDSLPRLLELELVEPALFLSYSTEMVEQLSREIRRRAGGE